MNRMGLVIISRSTVLKVEVVSAFSQTFLKYRSYSKQCNSTENTRTNTIELPFWISFYIYKGRLLVNKLQHDVKSIMIDVKCKAKESVRGSL